MPVSKQLLSGSIGGRQIKVAATASPGTLLHATGAGSTDFDEIWIWAVNSDTSSSRKLTIELGDVTAPDDLIEVTIPAEAGLVLVVPGLPLKGTGSAARNVRAFAAAANVVLCSGFVNRITP